jgi:hypothetical protein
MRARAARAKTMATRVPGKGRVGRGTATSTKREMATATRVGGDEESTCNGDAIATATRVAGIKEGRYGANMGGTKTPKTLHFKTFS